jgi:hypothetical protein
MHQSFPTTEGSRLESETVKTDGNLLNQSEAAASVSERNRPWPEECAEDTSRLYQAFQCWTYSYMGSILLKGSRQTTTIEGNVGHPGKISQDDLFVAPLNMQSPYLSTQFKDYFSNLGRSKSSSSTKRKLLLTLWKLAAPTFIPAGFCELITVLCQVAIPLLVRQLLNILEDNPNSQVIQSGMPCKLHTTDVLFFFVFTLARANTICWLNYNSIVYQTQSEFLLLHA